MNLFHKTNGEVKMKTILFILAMLTTSIDVNAYEPVEAGVYVSNYGGYYTVNTNGNQVVLNIINLEDNTFKVFYGERNSDYFYLYHINGDDYQYKATVTRFKEILIYQAEPVIRDGVRTYNITNTNWLGKIF